MGYSAYNKDGGVYVYKTLDDTHLVGQSRYSEKIWVFEAPGANEEGMTPIQVSYRIESCCHMKPTATNRIYIAGHPTQEIHLQLQ